MKDVTVKIKVRPFDVPDRVYLCCVVDGVVQDAPIAPKGFPPSGPASMHIRELSKETIDELVEQFRQGLYEKMKEETPLILARKIS